MPLPPERPKRERPGGGQSRRRRRGEPRKEQIPQPPLLKVVHDLATAAGVHDQFQTAQEFHLRLEHEPYEPLVIESWPASTSYVGEKRHISVAHYYYQEGDAIADPDILMTDTGYPIEMQRPLLYTQVLWHDPQRGTLVNTRAKRDIEEFMRMWARNIKDQGWLGVAKEYKEQHQGEQQQQ
jgi:uncharacterized protein DUF6908